VIPELYYSLEAGAKAPVRASVDASGFDLFAHEDTAIEPGRTVLVSTGVRLAIPIGFEAQVRPRSGLSLRTRLRVANSPGTIDADYRDLVSVVFENTASLTDPYSYLQEHPELIDSFNQHYHPVDMAHFFRERQGLLLPFGLPDMKVYLDGEGHPLGTIFIKSGERIAQLVFAKVEFPELIQVDDVSLIGNDRGGGFGSTGRV
jgi:dUTP pyrophosphatase